jgi:beta-lactamase class A
MKWPLAVATLIVVICAAVAPMPTAAAECSPGLTASDCDLQNRITAADAYLTGRPGSVGYVLRDRKTGATYRNSHAGDLIWTASTIKLAMVVDLLTRARTGSISLTESDQNLMAAMMHSSDDDAADTLWSRYGGTDHQAYNAAFPRYGMTDLQPQRGFSSVYPYWGFQKSTANDLDRLINYVLTQLPPAQTAAVVYELQNVASNQQWGVWGAGPSMAPGNKDGWSLEQGGWVVNSVGFAGPDQRYTLAVMNSLGGDGGYDDGAATTTRLSQLLLAGRDAH